MIISDIDRNTYLSYLRRELINLQTHLNQFVEGDEGYTIQLGINLSELDFQEEKFPFTIEISLEGTYIIQSFIDITSLLYMDSEHLFSSIYNNKVLLNSKLLSNEVNMEIVEKASMLLFN